MWNDFEELYVDDVILTNVAAERRRRTFHANTKGKGLWERIAPPKDRRRICPIKHRLRLARGGGGERAPPLRLHHARRLHQILQKGRHKANAETCKPRARYRPFFLVISDGCDIDVRPRC